MKRFLLILMAVLLMLPGCAGAPAETTRAPRETGFGYSLRDENRAAGIEMEDFEDNLDYDYVRWFYNGWYHYSPTEEEREQGIHGASWCSDWNLTMTAQKSRGTSILRGAMVLTSLDEYNAVLNAIDTTRTAALENCGTFWEPEETQQTWEGSFDEAFFEEHDLILVDYCCEGNPFLRSRLDRVSRKGGHVTVEISWETVHAYTADQPGEVYWIVMPKGCTDVTVEYTETAWN